MNKNQKRTLLALAALAIAVAVVNASVFAYYQIDVTITGVQPPVVFVAGNNANKADLGAGNSIAVALGANSTSAAITIHPTYQHTYYHDVLKVNNIDRNKAYYVAFKVTSAISSWPSDSVAKMIIYSSGGSKVTDVDLKANSDTGWIGLLDANDYYRIDFYIYYPEGNQLPGGTVQVQLIYSPQNPSTIPTLPS
ncbi:MAG: hypothetical protein B7O98_04500 [Zestosphaera tikiterensis]|uniref:Uncharacterized protein n=1 Tax=Zestosphaera tikiterensis TaxID=1973259 RepID=A0A2R7Y817_9CREN|nr:MAG: hypothetical protein B7O98_04500 [Zestosphaera tikiterensis]